jgi:hypothetical protein
MIVETETEGIWNRYTRRGRLKPVESCDGGEVDIAGGFNFVEATAHANSFAATAPKAGCATTGPGCRTSGEQ